MHAHLGKQRGAALKHALPKWQCAFAVSGASPSPLTAVSAVCVCATGGGGGGGGEGGSGCVPRCV